jgi:beta-glucosidase-like glycosyl hydrolase
MLRRVLPGVFLLVAGIGITPLTAARASTLPTTAVATVTAGCTDPGAWPLSQRLEQLLMVSGQFSDLGASTSMAAAGVGGFVFFGQPAAGSGPAIRSGVAAVAAAATAQGQVVPWLSTDEEGGPIARLSNVIGALPSPRQMAAQWTPAQVQSVLANHGSAMRSLGMTMDLAPVLDTASPTDPVAGESYRSFSENGEVAAIYSLAFANGLQAGGVVPVVKHFPGLGHASANTDLGPSLDPALSQLATDDLIPFEGAIAAGLPVVMVGHPMVPGLSGNVPASLSGATYQFLRGSLLFGGVAMTDDLDAGAISAAGYSQPAAAVRAIESGADMAMIDAGQWSATVNALAEAAVSGGLPLAQVNASIDRILAAKGITVCSPSTWKSAPGLATNIATGADGSVWVIGTNPVSGGYGIYRWTVTGWAAVPGGAVRIAVGPDGSPWVVNSAQRIYRRVGSSWVLYPGAAVDIAAGANGAVWVVGINPVPGGYGIYYWTGTGWAGVSGGAVAIAVGPDGSPWVVNSAQRIYRRVGSSWVLYPGAAVDIAAGANGAVWVVGINPVPGGYGIYRWTGTGWAGVSGGAVAIAVGASGRPWVVNSARHIYAA